ncbi:hypothetical protein GCM10010393_16050 [Streptomyces gobitricini]|uniref:Uncharacterized protein n=1 Tax=Streptomyces gobitricini TaxID=68211 RepID=A0ABN3LPL9_9ACTN
MLYEGPSSVRQGVANLDRWESNGQGHMHFPTPSSLGASLTLPAPPSTSPDPHPPAAKPPNSSWADA